MTVNQRPAAPIDRLKKEGWHAVLPLAAISFGMNALVLALPLYSIQIFDRVLHSGSTETLATLTFALVVVLAGMAVLENVRTRMMYRVGEWIEEVLLPQAASVAVGGGESGQHGSISDVRALRAFVAGPGALALIDVPWLPLFLALAFTLHPAIGWFTFLTAAVLLVLTVANELLTRRRGEEAGQAQARVMIRLGELTRSRDAAVGLGMLTRLIEREMAYNSAANRMAVAVTDVHAGIASLSKMIRLGSQSLVMAVAAYFVLNHDMSSGGMLAASILLGRALLPIDGALAGWRSFQAAREAWERLHDSLGKAQPRAVTMLPVPTGVVTVTGAEFVPAGSSRPVLSGVTLEIPAGVVLAVIGPSGCGKSTLCRLLVGALEPTSGTIRLDQSALQDWSELQRSRHIGYLPQDVRLLSGSVKDNIVRFSLASDDVVVEAAQRARCDELIRSLPGGYDFELQEGGAPLSGGQRQRIGLARALFDAPKLVVLDEPNAHLDSEGEADLVEVIRHLKRERITTVVVSHKQSVIAEADMLAVMSGGRLIHVGPAREMLGKLQAIASQLGSSPGRRAA